MAVKDQKKSKPQAVKAAGLVYQLKCNFKTAKPGVVLVKPSRVAELRRVLQLTQPEFAKLVPMSVRSLASLEAGTARTEAVARKLIELERLAKSLAEVMLQETIGTWLKTPNPAFDGLKPLEVIERGKIDRLWSMIYFLRSGVPC